MADFTNIIQEINTNIADNNTQNITAKKMRDTLIDLVDVIDENMNDFESDLSQDFTDLSSQLNDDFDHLENDIDNHLNNLVVDNLTSTNTDKALSANQGKILDDKINNLKENSVSKTIVNPINTDPVNGRLLQDGSIYTSGTAWKYFTYNLESNKNYIANLSVIGTNSSPALNYCGIQYFDESDNFLGYEVTSTSNKYNFDYYMTIPSGSTYCKIQTIVYTGYYPSKLWSYDYAAKEIDNINEILDSTIKYNEDLEFFPVWGDGSISYNNGGTTGTSNSNTGWIKIEGLSKIRYSRMQGSSTSSNAGMAFYSDQSISNYISGQRMITGATAGSPQYVDTIIDVPVGAKYARFSIWGTSSNNSSYTYFYVKNGDTFYLTYDNVKNIVMETINENGIIDLTGKYISIIGDSISCFGTETQTRTGGYNAPYWIVKNVDVGNEIESFVTWLDVYKTINNNSELTNTTIGGVTLTPSMIGTLQTFTPVAGDVGKSIGVARWASSYTSKPWWQILIEKTGAKLCNNASWSGSRMISIPEGSTRHNAFVMSEAFSDYTLGRVRNRDEEGNFIIPDIIFIYRGVNDFIANDPEGGVGDPTPESIETPNMITFNGITDETNFTQAYIWTILKLREKYPNTYIYCCTLNVCKQKNYSHYPSNNGTYTQIDYNNKIREIANLMGCGIVEFDKDGITFENCYPDYISDNANTPLHPNTNGHRVMAERAISDLKYRFNPQL